LGLTAGVSAGGVALIQFLAVEYSGRGTMMMSKGLKVLVIPELMQVRVIHELIHVVLIIVPHHVLHLGRHPRRIG
jgi:hypothetical protein